MASATRSAYQWCVEPVYQLDPPELHEHPGLRRALDERAARILDFGDGGSTPMPEQLRRSQLEDPIRMVERLAAMPERHGDVVGHRNKIVRAAAAASSRG